MGYLSNNDNSFAAALVSIAAEIQTETTWSILETVADGTGTRITLQKATTLETLTMVSRVQDSSCTEDGQNYSGILVRAGDGYNSGGATWNDRQDNGPLGQTTTNVWAGAIYHDTADQTVNFTIFTSEERIWVVLRIGDMYQHITFGFLEKVGTWTGGYYFGASTSGEIGKFDTNAIADNPMGLGIIAEHYTSDYSTKPANFFVHCEEPADGNNWQGFAAGAHTQALTQLGNFEHRRMGYMMGYNPNLSTLNTYLFSLEWMWYDTSIFRRKHIGNMQKTFVTSMYALADEEEIIVGGVTYIVFPFLRQSNATTITSAGRRAGGNSSSYYNDNVLTNSGHWGYAIEKEV